MKKLLTGNPGDLESKWLLNIAYMTTGRYPQQVPPQFLLKVINDDSMHTVKPSRDIASDVGLNYKCMAGGSLVDDFNNDIYSDVVISKMGGAYTGDAYENSLYLNPGQNKNHRVTLSLQGMVSNKAAIGAKIKVTFKEDNTERSVYRDVNSGGSFGSNPLSQHIGIGRAADIEKIEITWSVTGKVQVFPNPPIDTYIKITEGNKAYSTYNLNLARLNFAAKTHH